MKTADKPDYVIAIETTGAYASVALAKPGTGGEMAQIISKVNGHDRFSHLQNLTPQIQQVIEAGAPAGCDGAAGCAGATGGAALSINDVSFIAVSCGPGSFTGIRIGVSTARALAQVLDIPCVGVSSLEALAMRAGTGENPVSEDTLICPILDARRNQVYGGGYFIRDGFPVEEIEAGPCTLEEFIDKVKTYNKVCFLGDGVDRYSSEILQSRPDGTGFAGEEIRYQDAEQIARLGCRMYEEGKAVSYEHLKPEYMRLAEAERRLREQQAKEQAKEKQGK